MARPKIKQRTSPYEGGTDTPVVEGEANEGGRSSRPARKFAKKTKGLKPTYGTVDVGSRHGGGARDT